MKWILPGLFLLTLIACKHKKKVWHDTSNYFPTLSYLQSQVKALDTSLYSFIKITTINGRIDTAYINRSEVRGLANDFLTIPNLADSNQAMNYVESTLFDSLLNRAVLTYIDNDPEAEVPKQTINILQTGTSVDQVTTIYVEKEIDKDDLLTEKRMIWEVGKFFNIRTISKKKDQPETVQNVKVMWNEQESF